MGLGDFLIWGFLQIGRTHGAEELATARKEPTGR
jgi:hypothetical protein